MAALRAMLRVLRTETDLSSGYGPSSRLLRAATQAIHSSAQDETTRVSPPSNNDNYFSTQIDTRAAATPAPALPESGSPPVQLRDMSRCDERLRLTPTPCRTTVALNDDQPRHRGNYVSTQIDPSLG